MSSIRDMDWSHWFESIIAAFIGGGSSAVSTGFSVAITDPKNYSFGSWPSIRLMLQVFVISGVVSVFMFLKQSPIPATKAPNKTAASA